MAVETDGSRFAAGAWETLKRGISSLGVSTRALAWDHASNLGSRRRRGRHRARLRAAHRPLRSPDLRADRPLRHQDPGPAHHLRQHLRPRHPAGRHLLSQPVPCLVDRCEAREPARPGRDHCCCHCRQRLRRDRPHRARSRPAAGDRRRQKPVSRRRLRRTPAVDPARAGSAYPAATGAGGRYARARLRPRWDAHHRYRPAAVEGANDARPSPAPPAPGTSSSRTGGRAFSAG